MGVEQQTNELKMEEPVLELADKLFQKSSGLVSRLYAMKFEAAKVDYKL